MDVSSFPWYSTAATAAIVIIGLYFCLRNQYLLPRGISIGRPIGLPILGHALSLLPVYDVLNKFKKFTEQYGKIVEIYILFKRHLIISDLEVTKEMFHKRPKTFRRIRSLDYSAEVLGYITGLLHINGTGWSRIRKITGPSLSKPNVLSKVLNIRNIALKVVEELNKEADGKTIVAIDKAMLTYSFRIICLAAFGPKELSLLHQNYFFGSQFSHDVSATLDFFVEYSYFPFPNWIWRMTPFYRYESHAIECDLRFTNICKEIVQEKRQALLSNSSSPAGFSQHMDRNSLIESMLSYEEDSVSNNSPGIGSSGVHLVDGGGVTEDEILANVKIFFLGGSDTTSIAVTWALYYLSKDAVLTAALRKECAPIFLPSAVSIPTEELYDMVSSRNMPLCHAIFKETLRLCSPAAVVVSETESQTVPVVMSNGLIIYPGDEVFTLLDGILSDGDVFERPEEYNPYRWINSDKSRLDKMESTFIAFGYGPRICPGMALATVEAVMAISAIIHHFDLHLACPDSEIKRIFHFAANANKMPMYVTKRVL